MIIIVICGKINQITLEKNLKIPPKKLSKQKFDAYTLVYFLQLNLGQCALASNNSLWLCFVRIMLVNFNPMKQNTTNFYFFI